MGVELVDGGSQTSLGNLWAIVVAAEGYVACLRLLWYGFLVGALVLVADGGDGRVDENGVDCAVRADAV